MKAALFALIKSKTAITDLIGAGDDCRFYPNKLPQRMKTFPAATFRLNDIQPTNSFDGASTYDFNMIDMHCYGRTEDEAGELAETIRSEIEETVGTFASIEIDHIWFKGGGDGDFLEEAELYTRQIEFKIATRR